MAFTNRVRLPFKLQKPQFQEESERYRKANGEKITLSVVVRKIYEGITDELPEKLHERLKIALAHDHVVVEGERYVGVITQEGDYSIEWSDFLGRPIAQAKFKAEVTPFNASNSNCGTCEEYAQIVAVDDTIPEDLLEDTDYTIDVLANDSACCYPIVVTILSFNATYLDSAVVVDNQIVIHTKASMPDVNSVLLVTYRAECDNGQYDDADVFGNLNGTDPTPVCLAPTNPTWDDAPSDTSASFSWDAPSPIPDCGYHWEVRTAFSVLLQSGDTTDTDVTVTGLPSNEGNLRFYVRSNCCDDFNSNYAGPVLFSLPPPSGTESCGQYELSNGNIFPRSVSYLDCNANEQTELVVQFTNKQICALQNSPGNPVDLVAESGVTVTYLGLC